MVQILVNDSSKDAKAFLEIIKLFPFIKVIEEKAPNKKTLKALERIKAGKSIKTKGAKDLIEKMNS